MVTRSELDHAIRASARIMNQSPVLVLGSQSILGSWSEDELPARATASREVDIAPFEDEGDELSNLLEGAIGRDSAFDETNDFYVDGCSLRTSVLPPGWRERLVRVESVETEGFTGLALDPHDLVIAKLAAHRDKDREFVEALIEARLVSPRLIVERAEALEGEYAAYTERIVTWTEATRDHLVRLNEAARAGSLPGSPSPTGVAASVTRAATRCGHVVRSTGRPCLLPPHPGEGHRSR